MYFRIKPTRMKIIFSCCFLLLFSCSGEPERTDDALLVTRLTATNASARQLDAPELSVKVVDSKLYTFDARFGTTYEVTVELTNTGDRPFDRLYYSCDNPLKPTNPDVSFTEIHCNASYPMFRRMQPGEKMTEKIQLGVADAAISTRIAWRVTASNFLETDANGRVLDHTLIKPSGSWSFETEEITIPAKK